MDRATRIQKSSRPRSLRSFTKTDRPGRRRRILGEFLRPERGGAYWLLFEFWMIVIAAAFIFGYVSRGFPP